MPRPMLQRLLVMSCLLALGAAFLPKTFLQAAQVIYVSPSGNDSNPGTLDSPYRTIRKGVGALAAGDTLYVREGVYQETVYIEASGTADRPITVSAYPGEKPVIDGNNYQLPANEWGVLFRVQGNHVHVSGLEVRYSNWMGVLLAGAYDKASYMDVHHNRENGILVIGDYGQVEDSRVWYNCTSNEYGKPTRSGWASGLSAARHPNHAALRRNVVYNNWGEGLSTYEANGTIMEDNVVYDNHTNIYISDATNVLCQRNLVYATGTVVNAGSRVGIMMGDEKYNPPSSDIKVINNLVYGANRNYYWWQGVQGGGMKNVLVAHNTFVNSRSEDGVQINSGPHENVRFQNNIIQQDGPLPIALVPSNAGLNFANNLWSKAPPPTAASASDLVGDPKLAKAGPTDAGALTADWFRLLADAPAIDTAMLLAEVQDDFRGVPRGAKPDIGGLEYAASTATPGPATPTLTLLPPTATATVAPPTNTPLPPTEAPTNTPLPPTEAPTNTPLPPTEAPTNTLLPPTEAPSSTPLPTAIPTVTAAPATNTPLPTEAPTETATAPAATSTRTSLPTEAPTTTETPTTGPENPTAAPSPTAEPTATRPSYNQPPVVNAGPDQTIALGDVAQLQGSVVDDGRTGYGAIVQAEWRQESGPAPATIADASLPYTTASFSQAGPYVLILTANDGELSASDDVTIVVDASGEAVSTVESRVKARTDDAEERSTGLIYAYNGELDMADNRGSQTIGMRFSGLTIPPRAKIARATVQFKAARASTGECKLSIAAEDTGNGWPLLPVRRNISARPKTEAMVEWLPAPWPKRGDAGPDQQTPDLSPVIQQVVDRDDWARGNAIVIIITGSGTRVGASYDGDRQGAPLLHVEYTVPQG